VARELREDVVAGDRADFVMFDGLRNSANTWRRRRVIPSRRSIG
jgi:hypothetical protein